MSKASAVKYAKFGSTTPVIVGVAQWTNKGSELIDPYKLCLQTAKQALADSAGDQEKLRSVVDSVVMIEFNSWTYEGGNKRLPQRLSDDLQLNPRCLEYTKVGGNTPQLKVNEACVALEKGEIKGVLITGAEAINSMIKATDMGLEKAGWPEGGIDPPDTDTTELEAKYSLSLPVRVYPLIETAIRASKGHTPAQHSKYMGDLFARYSEVASKNPHAWFNGVKHSSEAISTPSANNRYVVYPYTKLMNAFPMTNQSASVVLTTVHQARLCGIPEDKWVFPMGGANFFDVHDVTRRRNMAESQAVRECARLAFEQAGVTLDEIQHFDIYSCFPSAVQVAMKEIGIPDNDPRPLTVTGGLPYFGGPGNSYSTHAIVSVVEKIRAEPTSKGLVYANGMYITKHALGVYGKTASKFKWAEQASKLAAIQEIIFHAELPPLVEKGEGPLKVEGFIIHHNKKTGKPQYGVILGTLVNSGARTLANIAATETELEQMEKVELVGMTGNCVHDPASGKNKVSFSLSKL